MKTETAIGAALAKAGLAKHQMRAFSTAIDFVNAGGTRGEWIQVYDLVANKITAKAEATPKVKVDVKTATPRVTPQGPSKTSLRARAEARDHSSRSIFDRYVTHSGRQWGNVTYTELDSMADDGNFAAAIKQHIGPLSGPSRYKKIRDLINAREFAALATKVGVQAN
jgi:hypothetical protein